LVSCKNDHQLLEGHWHLKYVDEQRIEQLRELDIAIENTIDYKGQVGRWNENMTMSFPLGIYIDNLENSMMITNADCFQEDYFYEINDNTLFLKDSIDNVVHKGLRCVDNCCTDEDDFFLRTNLVIELPLLEGMMILEELEDVPLSAYWYDKIYLGKDRITQKYKLKCGFHEERPDIKKWVEKIGTIYQIRENEQHQIFAFIDKQSPLDSVKVILNDFKNSGVKDLIIVGKKEEEFKFQFKKVSTDIVIPNEGISFQQWISNTD